MSLPLILAAAVEHAAEPGIPEKFGLEWKYVLIQIVSFLIVLVVLYKYGIKPVTATMEERQKKIASGIEYADEMKAKLAAAQQSIDAQLREAQVKAQAVVAEAQKAAKEFADKQQQEAIEKANGLITKAQQAIELEKKKMLAEARTEIARLVVATTQRVLSKELSESDRSKYADSAARELANV